MYQENNDPKRTKQPDDESNRDHERSPDDVPGKHERPPGRVIKPRPVHGSA